MKCFFHQSPKATIAILAVFLFFATMILSGCDTFIQNGDEHYQTNGPSLSAEEEREYIAILENMLNSYSYDWYSEENVTFSAMSNDEIIHQYIAKAKAPSGMYQYFSKESMPYLPKDNQFIGGGKQDPKQRYYICYELDADLLDWMLLNVFGKTPDRTIDTEDMYYYENRVYIQLELGGGSSYEHRVENYEKMTDGTYKLNFISQGSPSSIGKHRFTMIASPNNDKSYGKYWTILSYQGVKLTKNEAFTLAQGKSGYIHGQDDGDYSMIEFVDMGEIIHNGEPTHAFQIRRVPKVEGSSTIQELETIFVDIDSGICYWEANGMTGTFDSSKPPVPPTDNYWENKATYEKFLKEEYLAGLEAASSDSIVETCMQDLNDDGTYELLLTLTSPDNYREAYSHLLAIQNQSVVVLDKQEHRGGSMGGAYAEFMYDENKQKHIYYVQNNSFITDGDCKGTKHAYSYDGNQLCEDFVLSYEKYNSSLNYNAEKIQTIKASNPYYHVEEYTGLICSYSLNGMYVPKDEWDAKCYQRIPDIYTIVKGTVLRPFGD